MRTYLITLGLAFTGTAQGVLLYTEGPAWRRESESAWGYVQSIDMNGDGTRDFFTSTYGGELSLIPTGNNRILSTRATLPDLGRYILGMDGGELIGGAPTFGEFLGLSDRVNQFDHGGANIYKCNGRVPVGEPEYCISAIYDGNRINYLGVEFESNGLTHYGWISVSALFLSSQHEVNVNGWVYETLPNQALSAGAIPIPEPGTTLLIGIGTIFLLFYFKGFKVSK